ncbi:SGNH/GDSL hydrolase family protein [Rhizobacter sp. LjRoot28]|uniref:SGNH/GDSL hydrolase family protein n=1 Tax=Rhizobacter sp. LjRoot28 TaxID=3342309 RepID=UPI003ECC77BF
MHPLLSRVRFLTRRAWLAGALAAGALSGLSGCAWFAGPPTDYVATWNASQQDRFERIPLPGWQKPEEAGLQGQTLRQVVRASLGGDGVRVKLSNRFGRTPVTFDAVRIARATAASSIDPSTDRAVTHNGLARITLAPGTELWSDTVALPVSAQSLLAVSIQASGAAPFGTQHTLARQTAYVVPGALASATTFPYPQFLGSYHWLAGVDVIAQGRPPVLVAFGDSITDGYAASADQSRRYPDVLDDRLKAAGLRMSVVNAGISGNRWLNDVIGPSGESRFVRDVLEVSGVTHAVVLLGVNDIGFAQFAPDQAVSAESLIDAMRTAIGKARARGVKVILGTLLPYEGARYFSTAGETKRQAVNAWIRTPGHADGLVDFDAAVRDPSRPSALKAAYDSGDHLHPNDAGYAAMAQAVDLTLLR